jgi:hypothetical protein
MEPNKQVSPAIRILRGERDASARATHLEAATRKFLVTTNERKQMSTKTNFKRIALVAVAALGLGLLSSVPSQALIQGTPTVTVENGTAGISGQKSDSSTAATIAVRYFADGTADTATITLTLGSRPAGATSVTLDGASLLVTALDTATSTGLTTTAPVAQVTDPDSRVATTLPVITAGANSFAAAKFGVHLDSSVATRVAGTYTINYVVRFLVNGAADTAKTQVGTFNIVVSDATSAAATATTASATSSATLATSGGLATTTGDDSGVIGLSTATGTAIASIRVIQKTAAGLASRESITVTTNIGLVGNATTLGSSTLTGKSVNFLADADGDQMLYVFADGSSGKANIDIKTTSVTFSSKSVTFYSDTVASIVAVQLGSTLGSTASGVIAAKALDASGNQIFNDTSVYAFSSDLNVINTGATTGTVCTYQSSLLVHVCSLSGSNDGTASITLRNKSTVALSTVASNVITGIKVNTKSPVAIKLAFDKATYAPGEAAYVRLWAVDSAGNPVAPGARNSLLASGGISSTATFGNGTITDSLTVNSVSPTLGYTTASARGFASTEPIYLVKVFMPSSGGTIKLSATGGTLLPAAGQVEVSASATVTDSGAAALAAVNALATTVASLRTLITTLTNLVLKIQKKVKA